MSNCLSTRSAIKISQLRFAIDFLSYISRDAEELGNTVLVTLCPRQVTYM